MGFSFWRRIKIGSLSPGSLGVKFTVNVGSSTFDGP